LNRRLKRLRAARGKTGSYKALRDFLADEFSPLLARVTHWSKSRLQAAGMSFTKELSWSQRTLSPSDFGFHNTLRRPDGRIIFLDFEYFGWDDPAKMIADFLLHPAMNLSQELKKKFTSAVFRRFSDWPSLPARVESVYPLFGLKWCLIMLNEFLPEELLRRQFAATAGADRSALQTQQLNKARQMWDRISREYECFPYRD
jgi:thiamine kinase-like enzyme